MSTEANDCGLNKPLLAFHQAIAVCEMAMRVDLVSAEIATLTLRDEVSPAHAASALHLLGRFLEFRRSLREAHVNEATRLAGTMALHEANRQTPLVKLGSDGGQAITAEDLAR